MAEMSKKEKERLSLRQEFRERIVGYILAAFGLVAGLAWNEAIKSLIEYFFPMNQNTLLAKFSYAFLVTVALVLVTVYVSKLFLNKQEKK